jgi:hypothetical protein
MFKYDLVVILEPRYCSRCNDLAAGCKVEEP